MRAAAAREVVWAADSAEVGLAVDRAVVKVEAVLEAVLEAA